MKNRILLLFLFISVLTNAQQKKIKVACVGNSVTYGYLLPNREAECYPSQLQLLLGDKYEVMNFGKSGATLLTHGHRPYVEQQEYADALKYAADIVVIHLGLNDTDPRNWPNYQDEFFSDYLNLINSFRQKNRKSEIWICRMTPITHKHPRFISGTRDWHGEIQQVIEQVANYAGTKLIDLEKPFSHRPDLLPDAIHPNAKGAEIIAKTVYSSLTGNYGGLKTADIYSDNMVLQRNQHLKIHGTSNARDEITISIDNQKLKTTAKENGQWMAELKPMEAGGPHTLEISTPSKKLSYRNVMIGEVWLCSGQSNMAFRLNQDADYVKIKGNASHSNIRLFNMQPKWETYAKEWEPSALDSINDLQYFGRTGWQECDEKSAALFSAVAYHFGKSLADSLNITIGLINNAVGGSPTESWIGRKRMEYDFPAILTNWKQNDFIQQWVRERAMLNIKKSQNPEQRHPFEPCYLFESGIAPLAQYPIAGVIWYQGESNAHNIEAHEKLFPLLIKSWRENWQSPQLPFYYVQLSSLNRPSWTHFRDSQRRLMNAIPNAYMAVSSDCGDSLDVHPTHKQAIGLRLALWALNKNYSKKYVTPSGPLYKSAEFIGENAYVEFLYNEGLKAQGTNKIIGFELAETDGLFYSAQAEIIGNKVRVWSDKVLSPKVVRYGWQPYTRSNLINQYGLPASTFKTE